MTTTTITDQQIRALRTEASRAGDGEQVVICERALATDETWNTDAWFAWHGGRGLNQKFYSRMVGMNREEARGICAAVINDASETYTPVIE